MDQVALALRGRHMTLTDEADEDYSLVWPSSRCTDQGVSVATCSVTTDYNGRPRPGGRATAWV